MKILFLDSSPIWLNCLPHGFKDLGHEVKASGPLTENNISEMMEEFEPNLVVTVGWGPEHTKIKQNWIRNSVKSANIPHIYWAVEDPHFTTSYTLPLLMRMQPDFVFSLSTDMVNFYRKIGIPSAHLDFGFHSNVHRTVDFELEYSSPISLVANAYPQVLKEAPSHFRHQSLKNLVEPLLKRKTHINLWGKSWNEMDNILSTTIPSNYIKGYIDYTSANKVYSSSEIMLGLQNYKTQVTQRTYEILACGGFLITSDTPAVRKLFKPGHDLVVSSSPEETIALIEYYLKNPQKRKKIQKNGQITVQDYSYTNKAEYIINCLINEGLINEKTKKGEIIQ